MEERKWEPGMLPTTMVTVLPPWEERLGVTSFEAFVGRSCTEGEETTTTICWRGVNYTLRLGLGWSVIGISEDTTTMFDNAMHPFNIVWNDKKIQQVIQHVLGWINEIQVENGGVTQIRYRGLGFDWMTFTLDGQYAITFKDNQRALSFVEHCKQLYPGGEGISVTVV